MSEEELTSKTTIWSGSIYGMNSRRGLVEVVFEGEGKHLAVRMLPEDARSVAHQIVEAAEAATLEECLMRFLQEEIGVELEQAAQLLAAWRRYRMDESHP